MKRRLGSGRISPPAGFEPATPLSEVGSANRSTTDASFIQRVVTLYMYVHLMTLYGHFTNVALDEFWEDREIEM